MRQIILDTETTGIDPKQGHRIVEIGCVEMVDRKLTGNNFHVYINPQRLMEQEVINVHGITNEFVADKPVFAQIADDFYRYLQGAQLVIHNAPFDMGFMNHEFQLLQRGFPPIEQFCSVEDTLQLARKKHPGQKNNLDALCKRYHVDNSARTFHGALLDAEILADVYLLMTGGQKTLLLGDEENEAEQNPTVAGSGEFIIKRLAAHMPTPVIGISDAEQKAHEDRLALIQKKSGGNCLWLMDEA